MNQDPQRGQPLSSRDVCFYDGRCGMCVRSAKWVGRLDWLSRIDFRDLSTDPSLPMSIEDTMAGMPMVTRSGKTLIGFPAMRRAIVQTPLGFIPGLLMYLPGISHLGTRVYKRAAAHRKAVVCKLQAE
ncbi:MAG: DUF393 domain-containing protein [Phycisphaeraceae bacterium]|nr:DUF393 domain-containing protein [Phycisphaerales bacterium]MCB9859709.1 DUF393 domain-containing protein [Phycisphaeraceae bacterium]